MRQGWWRRPLVWAAIVVAVWLIAGGPLGSFQGQLSQVQENDSEAFLPATAEATRAGELERQLTDADVVPAVLLFARAEGLTEPDRAHLAAIIDLLAQVPGVAAPPAPPVPSEDGAAAQLVVLLADQQGIADTVAALREISRADAPTGLDMYVTGPAGFVADLTAAFGDIDGRLLMVTASVVAVILVLVYRSPLLPLVVLIGAGLALGTAAAAVYGLASADVIILTGQSQGIMLILVFGAATDYALLLVARYREELRIHRDRFTAMNVAWRRSVGPILASGTTVILALLCLLLSDLNSNRSLGPVAAIGIAAALLVMLTYLPAMLSLLGRIAFWPFRPQHGTVATTRGFWPWLAGLIGRRSRPVWLVTLLVLAGLAALLPQLRAEGVANTDLFLAEAETATGQEVLARHFPAGGTAPTVIIAAADRVEPVVAAARQVPGVAEVRPEGGDEQLSRIAVVLDAPADSDAAIATVSRLRTQVHAIPGADALVGGQTAIALDTRAAASRDLFVIIPLALLVVFLIIAWLLRALVVPALLLGSVLLSFAATLGLSAVVFNQLFQFPGADPSLPLFAFVFLVALGVDYSIFLMTRVREEAGRLGTRPGVQAGLAVTGRVITSAGIVLAATFAALGVVPILFLAQIGFIVAVGVLIDTFVVRSLLVPGLCHDIGRRVWWPSRLAHQPRDTATTSASGG